MHFTRINMFTLEQIENARNLATQDFNNSTANRLGHLLKRFLNLNLIDSYDCMKLIKKNDTNGTTLEKIQTEMFCVKTSLNRNLHRYSDYKML